jgi:hypothetical protein
MRRATRARLKLPVLTQVLDRLSVKRDLEGTREFLGLEERGTRGWGTGLASYLGEVRVRGPCVVLVRLRGVAVEQLRVRGRTCGACVRWIVGLSRSWLVVLWWW